MERHPRVHRGQARRQVALPPVGLADLVDAVRLLRLRSGDLPMAAELLRLRRVAAPVSRPAAARSRVASPSASTSDSPTAPVARQPETFDAVRRLPVSVTARPAEPVAAPVSPRALSDLLPRAPSPPPPTQGLFTGSNRRALFRGITATRAREGELDVDAAVELLASNRTLDQIPLEWIETTRGQMQLLLDVGRSMDPYRPDVDRLPTQLIRVFGEDGLDLRWFEDCPLGPSGVLAPEQPEATPFVPPPARTRIVAVTVFGARGPIAPPPETTAAWRRLATRCRRTGVPLLVLTPLAPERQPRGLGANIATVTWDDGTRVRDVARAVRRAGRT